MSQEGNFFDPEQSLSDATRKEKRERILATIAELEKDEERGWPEDVWTDLLDEFRNDKEIFLKLVQKFGPSYYNTASDELQDDPEFFFAAVEQDQDGWINSYVVESFLRDPFINDREKVKAIIKAHGEVLSRFPEFKDDEELARLALISYPESIVFMKPEFQKMFVAEDPELQSHLDLHEKYSKGLEES